MTDTKVKKIDTIVFNALKDSKSLGVFPTPIDRLIKHANLRENNNLDLNQFSKASEAKIFGSRHNIGNIRGMLDRERKIIYIDSALPAIKKRFVSLHEVGHELCTWQGDYLKYLDDDDTLNSDISAGFEAEANYFASASLFQQDYFTEHMGTLPLQLKSAVELSKMFGASIHAALRRMVEKNEKRCSLLVLNVDNTSTRWAPVLRIKNYFQSKSFTREFGVVQWASPLEENTAFVRDYGLNRKFFTSILSNKLLGNESPLAYDYFDNKYNIFVLIYPIGENKI